MQLSFHEGGGKTVLSLNNIQKEDSEGWLAADLSFNYQGFTAGFSIYFMLVDIYAFLDKLKELNKNLRGKANFANMEGNIDLELSGDGLGYIGINGKIRHCNDYNLVTSFEIPCDQTFLSPLIWQCEELIEYARSA